jgi:predicted nucleic acid-binding protein
MKAVTDTRFLVAHFFGQDELTTWTRTTLRTLQSETNLGIVPSMAIHEFYKFALQTKGRDVANMRVESILMSNLTTVNLDPLIGIEAAKLRCQYAELPTADAIIAATAIATSADCVLTDDKHIKQIKETKTKWKAPE